MRHGGRTSPETDDVDAATTVSRGVMPMSGYAVAASTASSESSWASEAPPSCVS